MRGRRGKKPQTGRFYDGGYTEKRGNYRQQFNKYGDPVRKPKRMGGGR